MLVWSEVMGRDTFVELVVVGLLPQFQLPRFLARFGPSVMVGIIIRELRLVVAVSIIRIERPPTSALEQTVEGPQPQRTARGVIHFCRYNYPERIAADRR